MKARKLKTIADTKESISPQRSARLSGMVSCIEGSYVQQAMDAAGASDWCDKYCGLTGMGECYKKMKEMNVDYREIQRRYM